MTPQPQPNQGSAILWRSHCGYLPTIYVLLHFPLLETARPIASMLTWKFSPMWSAHMVDSFSSVPTSLPAKASMNNSFTRANRSFCPRKASYSPIMLGCCAGPASLNRTPRWLGGTLSFNRPTSFTSYCLRTAHGGLIKKLLSPWLTAIHSPCPGCYAFVPEMVFMVHYRVLCGYILCKAF